MLDIPLSVRVEEWKRKVLEGTITTEEMRECILALRAGRMGAAATSARSRASKAPVDIAGMENELDNL